MQTVKILITGPFSAGKTTFIKTISEISVVSTEKDISDHTKSLKSETTVAMDFGKITIDENVVLYLFGTPGQERFDFMWETLSEGMLGYILLIDGVREKSMKEASNILKFFKKLSDVPYLVAINKSDLAKNTHNVKGVKEALSLNDEIPILECNSLKKEDVKEVLLGLLYIILENFEDKSMVKSG